MAIALVSSAFQLDAAPFYFRILCQTGETVCATFTCVSERGEAIDIAQDECARRGLAVSETGVWRVTDSGMTHTRLTYNGGRVIHALVSAGGRALERSGATGTAAAITLSFRRRVSRQDERPCFVVAPSLGATQVFPFDLYGDGAARRAWRMAWRAYRSHVVARVLRAA